MSMSDRYCPFCTPTMDNLPLNNVSVNYSMLEIKIIGKGRILRVRNLTPDGLFRRSGYGLDQLLSHVRQKFGDRSAGDYFYRSITCSISGLLRRISMVLGSYGVALALASTTVSPRSKRSRNTRRRLPIMILCFRISTR